MGSPIGLLLTRRSTVAHPRSRTCARLSACPRRPPGVAYATPGETEQPPTASRFSGVSFCPFQDVSFVPSLWNFLAKSMVCGRVFRLHINSRAQTVETLMEDQENERATELFRS